MSDDLMCDGNGECFSLALELDGARKHVAEIEATLQTIATLAMTAQSDPHASADAYRSALRDICNRALGAREGER